MTKRILLTGGSSEIGNAIYKKLSENIDYAIGEQYFQSEELTNSSDKYYCDFEIYEGGLIDSFIDRNKKIDVLINCAGVLGEVPFEELTVEDYDRVMGINSRAPYILCSEAFGYMKEDGGKIINISSFTTKYGMGRNNTIHYAASKATLDILTIGLAKIGAPYNILVNSISPGVIDTEKQDKSKADRIPLKRLGAVEDIANMVNYLVSDKGNFITGQNIFIAGGE